MSETEDAATTVARLLKAKMRAVKDNGALASISVTSEWQSTDAFKGYDGQVTVGVAEVTDHKIELSGKTRRRLSFLRVNVWATDTPRASETGRVMRGKIVEEVNRVVRQNRSKPNETLYDFFNTGPTTQTHKVYRSKNEASPDASVWTELSSEHYQQLWYSDDNPCQVSYGENGDYAAMLFRFKIESREKTVKKIVLSFEGYGTASSGNGVAVKVWNHEAGAWQNAQTGGAGGTDQAITITLVSDLPNYIDDDGYVWLLARTTNPSNGSIAAVLYCDFIQCTMQVYGITYCDVVSYRNIDVTDVKPYLYRVEFLLKGWLFESISGVF